MPVLASSTFIALFRLIAEVRFRTFGMGLARWEFLHTASDIGGAWGAFRINRVELIFTGATFIAVFVLITELGLAV